MILCVCECVCVCVCIYTQFNTLQKTSFNILLITSEGYIYIYKLCVVALSGGGERMGVYFIGMNVFG